MTLSRGNPPRVIEAEPKVPEGMTAQKLRGIAEWLDTYDRLARATVELFEAQAAAGISKPIGGDHEKVLAAADGKELQEDLRRWADELEAPITSQYAPMGGDQITQG